jgi:Domain of unknown function (DUF4440)
MSNSRLLQFIACLFVTASVPLSASSADDAVAAVLAADRARGAALLAADVKALDRLLADDLRYTHSNGMLETKAIHIGTLNAGLRYARFETSKLHGQVIAPGVVVLTGTINQRKGTAEKWTDFNNLLFHAVWRLDAGGWRLASLQTAVPPAPAAPAK